VRHFPRHPPLGSATQWGRPAELPQPRQPLQVFRARPYPKPAVALWDEPPSGPRRRLAAVGGLELVVVDHLPTSARLSDEPWARVAWFGHAVHHGTTVDPRALSPVERASNLGVNHRGISPLLRRTGAVLSTTLGPSNTMPSAPLNDDKHADPRQKKPGDENPPEVVREDCDQKNPDTDPAAKQHHSRQVALPRVGVPAAALYHGRTVFG